MVAGYAAVFCLLSTVLWASDIDVSGVFWDAKGASALVNDKIVSEGDSVEGVKVVKITDKGVMFSRDGSEFFQRLKTPSKEVHSQYKMSFWNPKKSTTKPVPQEDSEASPVPSSSGRRGSPQQMLEEAYDLKAQADAKRSETERRIRQMEKGY